LKRITILCLALLCVASASAFADTLFLTPPTGSFLGFGAGGTRGDYVTMTADFTLTSIGIQAEINNGAQETFSAYVYDGLGQNQLAVGNNMVFTGDGTEQFYNLPINFTLLAGHSYDIGIDFHSFNDPNLQVHYYFFDAGTNPPFNVAPFTVTDGEESHCGACNIFAPNLEVNGSGAGVPEPGTFVMLGTGALGLAGVLKRKLVG
jgi:hypothetical protein